ncbi:MAG: T3SS effector OspC family protein [Candidatus Rhabdochlamydia sp.]
MSHALNLIPHQTKCIKFNIDIHNSKELSIKNNCLDSTIKTNKVEAASNKIKKFLRKTIAAQSYGYMFANGEYFTNGLNIQPKNLYSFSSLRHLEKISTQNLNRIKNRISNLSSDELHLKAVISSTDWAFRHQSNFNLENKNKTLIISSNKMLENKGFSNKKHTFQQDKKKISNHDFVFWGVEFSGCYNEKKPPLNTKHTTVDFGANSFLIHESNPICQYGFFTLTDHLDTQIPFSYARSKKIFTDIFPIADKEATRKIIEEHSNGLSMAPIFSVNDMKTALSLYLIEFIRKTEDLKFKEFIFNKETKSNSELEYVLNTLFQPEFHTPRLVSTKEYQFYKLRDTTLKEDVEAGNIDNLSSRIKNKEDAISAIYHAVSCSQDNVASYLLEKWDFKDSDFANPPHHDLIYTLSNYSANIKLLKLFLDKKLIDPNQKFKRVNAGETMLDNAVKYSLLEMIKVLLEYGAEVSLLSSYHKKDYEKIASDLCQKKL